jgi:hypothetical protein
VVTRPHHRRSSSGFVLHLLLPDGDNNAHAHRALGQTCIWSDSGDSIAQPGFVPDVGVRPHVERTL